MIVNSHFCTLGGSSRSGCSGRDGGGSGGGCGDVCVCVCVSVCVCVYIHMSMCASLLVIWLV